MAELIGKALGNEKVAEAIGKQAGHAVELGVKKAMSGNKSHDGKKKAGGAGGAGGAGAGGAGGAGAGAGGGGGFDVADVLDFGSGQKDDGTGGGLGKAVGGLFK